MKAYILCCLWLVFIDRCVGGLAVLHWVQTRFALLVVYFNYVCVFYFTINKNKKLNYPEFELQKLVGSVTERVN